VIPECLHLPRSWIRHTGISDARDNRPLGGIRPCKQDPGICWDNITLFLFSLVVPLDEISQTLSENRADGKLRQGVVSPHSSRGQSSSIPRFPDVHDPTTR